MSDNRDDIKSMKEADGMDMDAPLASMLVSFKIIQEDINNYINLKSTAVKEGVRNLLITEGVPEAELEQRIDMNKEYLRWNIEKLGSMTALDNIKNTVATMTCVVYNNLNIEATAMLIQNTSIEHTGNTFMEALETKNDLYHQFKEEFNQTCVTNRLESDDILLCVVSWIMDNVMSSANIDDMDLAELQGEDVGDA